MIQVLAANKNLLKIEDRYGVLYESYIYYQGGQE